ncbi:hypothetical protein F4553_000599 [Allocatelliglobosispora scoriae]|uniref:WD40 repeat domain-containing protein n=1 Tax=Allocatelliglobosispora scoriae TaxID=643052 RepID=A0A841BK80_9ACTN|nr:hypothetical protein [Allocatelliglobosispora scoriae]MBB5867220.1 hypothetical protein [Allocatelliglobosispora scoriae]
MSPGARSRSYASAGAVALCIALLVGGCTATPAAQPSAARPSPGQSGAPAATQQTVALPVARLAVKQHNVGHLSLSGDRLAFTSSGEVWRHGTADRVMVMDLVSGKRRTVARTGYPNGMIVSLAATGDHVVWTEQVRPGDPDRGFAVPWRMHLTNVVTGTDLVIEQSPKDSPPPQPVVARDGLVVWEGQVVWDDNQEAGRTVHAYSIADRRRTVLTLGGAGADVSQGWFTYGTHWLGEVHAVPATGGRAVRLDSHGGAVNPAAAAGRVAWFEAQPARDYGTIWTARLPGSDGVARAAVQVGAYATADLCVPGEGFVVFHGSDGLVARTVGDTAVGERLLLVAEPRAMLSMGVSSDGDRVAWAEAEQNDWDEVPTTELVVAEISTAHS